MPLQKLSRPRPLDVAIAASLLLVSLFELLFQPFAEDVIGGPLWLDLVAVTLGTVPLAWRRQFPFAVTLVVFGALATRALVSDPLEIYPTIIALFVAGYSLAAYATFRDALIGAGYSGLAFAVAASNGSGQDSAPDPIPFAILYGLVFAVGRAVAVSTERARRVHEDRDRHAAEAVTAERDRIAREMHDVVSHSLAAIVMQSGGARNVIDQDPARAKAALGQIEASARRGPGRDAAAARDARGGQCGARTPTGAGRGADARRGGARGGGGRRGRGRRGARRRCPRRSTSRRTASSRRGSPT